MTKQASECLIIGKVTAVDPFPSLQRVGVFQHWSGRGIIETSPKKKDNEGIKDQYSVWWTIKEKKTRKRDGRMARILDADRCSITTEYSVQ